MTSVDMFSGATIYSCAECGEPAPVKYYGRWLCNAHAPDTEAQARDWAAYQYAASTACINAGLSTEALTGGIVAWLIEQARGREWAPSHGVGRYCRECGGTPDRADVPELQAHTGECVTGRMYRWLETAEGVQE